MVKIGLFLSCTVTEIDELRIGDDYSWNLKLECQRCHEKDAVWHAISADELVQGSAGPGSFNFQMKCKFCSNTFTINIVPGSVKALKSDDSDRIKKQQVVAFECRGVEPIDFDPQGFWTAVNNDRGSVFSDIDFSEEGTCWEGYDEKGSCLVTIEDLTWSFARV